MQHARPPCPSPTPGAYSMSITLVMPSNHLILCHPFSSHLQSFPASASFPMSWLFTSGGHSIGVSALGCTDLFKLAFSFPSGLCPGVEPLEHTVVPLLAFKRLSVTSSIGAPSVYIPTSSVQVLSSLSFPPLPSPNTTTDILSLHSSLRFLELYIHGTIYHVLSFLSGFLHSA